jgi:hypothetical protein
MMRILFGYQCENNAMRMMMGMGTPRNSRSSERMEVSER